MLNNFINLPDKAYNDNFMWVAEYRDGTLFYEYEPNSLRKNDFKDIIRIALSKFGMFGFGCKIYFDVNTGMYYEVKRINNKDIINTYQFLYVDENNTEYNFMGKTVYNDIIQFKSSSIFLSLNSNPNVKHGNGLNNQIEDYNFGYKSRFQIDGINFNFQTIVTFNPHNKPMEIKIKLVADKKLNGNLVVRKNGFQDFKYYAPLEIGNAGMITWVVR